MVMHGKIADCIEAWPQARMAWPGWQEQPVQQRGAQHAWADTEGLTLTQ